MDVRSMVEQACANVGIAPPRDQAEGRWLTTDTTSGKNGRGDGRVKIDPDRVTAWNWQTGERSTVRSGVEPSPADRRRIVQQREQSRREAHQKAERAASIATRLVAAARAGTHPYLARKGFPAERVALVDASMVVDLVGQGRDGSCYLVPADAKRALVIPARVRDRLTSCQLVWEDGTKKFLAGGEMGGATFRLASGAGTWLCEGFATALSLRAALRAMNRRDGILVCFSAHNLAAVAKGVAGRAWIAADHDKPLEQHAGLGTGEHYARIAGQPYAMPPDEGTDINDMHIGHGLFAVQRLLGETIRGAMHHEPQGQATARELGGRAV